VSVYSYFKPAEALVNGTLLTADSVVLSVIAIAGTVIGGAIFFQRDLPS
jgi:hypothetical protein